MSRLHATPAPVWTFLVMAMSCSNVRPRVLAAQSQYYNLDAGRPTRVEDAEPMERYALGLDLMPVQWEHLDAGTLRMRAEPRVTYGVLPFTDIEVRLPLVEIVPPARSGAATSHGMAGLALGGLHQFNLETWTIPAIAISGEALLPVGSLAPSTTSYLAKMVATRTTRWGRVHLNAGGGTYAVRSPSADTACTPSALVPAGAAGSQGCGAGPPIIADDPCAVAPPPRGATIRASVGRATPDSTTSTPRSRGTRWFGGIGIDHAFPLASTLIMADVVAEQFVGLYPRADWTAEVGARRQLTPLIVIDGGAGWHFAGTYRSLTATFGASYEVALPPVGRR